MKTTMAGVVWALVLLVASVSSARECNKEDGFVCVTDTVYQVCVDGTKIPHSEVLICPKGTRCSPDCDEPCLPSQMTPCITCNANGFHCTSDGKKFLMCLANSNTTEPGSYDCAPGTICSDYCPNQCTYKPCNPKMCDSPGKKPNPANNRNFFLCSATADAGIHTVMEYTCPGTSIFKAGVGCVKDDTVKPSPVICPGSGRYPDPTSVQGYYYCTPSSSGYQATYMMCPTGTKYDTPTKKCAVTTGTQTFVLADRRTEFTCTSSGIFPNPLDCNTYIICTPSADSELSASYYDCPEGSYFSPDILRCSADRPDNCAERQLPSTEATFKCLQSGRVLDPTSCSHYYWCSPEDLEAYRMPCPDGSRFNPDTNKCTNVDDFECPK